MEEKDTTLREKGKRIGLTLGVGLLVYGSFRYLLKPALPFLLAWMAASFLRPAAKKLAGKLPFFKEGLAVGLIMAVFSAGIAAIVLFLGRALWQQACRAARWLPVYAEQFRAWFADCCYGLESQLSMERGTLLEAAYQAYDRGLAELQDGSVSQLMDHSMSLAAGFGTFFAAVAVTVVAVILTVKDWDRLRAGLRRSYFWEELCGVTARLSRVGKVYLKSQLIIMALTAVICTAGLFLLGNSYALLLGVLLGLLDALPLFGTGTVFFPWVLVCLLQGFYMEAAGLGTIYVVCYFVREFLETRLMGDGIGVTPLETLISMYVGFYLFGVLGFLLGPAGYFIIKELTAQWLTNEPVSFKMESRKHSEDEE